MSVNGVTEKQNTDYMSYAGVSKKQAASDNKTESKAAVYEATNKKLSESDRAALVQKLKADTQNRISQMQELVTKMFSKQGVTIGTADDMWKALASGNFTADPETIKQAREDISEDGYWGVKQTSERIFDFAKALSGGDEEKMRKMQEAFEKGFKEATKAWGKSLPDISSQTYDAVNKKFEEFYNQE